ncbi:hypothetical protein AGR1A_Cc50556 [Agrobacterium fabacearum CFBP 5771]|nr:hypothetical protein AGR1A_Cc50556 [Agrobacterium fabacearum CFBP 5771]
MPQDSAEHAASGIFACLSQQPGQMCRPQLLPSLPPLSAGVVLALALGAASACTRSERSHAPNNQYKSQLI